MEFMSRGGRNAAPSTQEAHHQSGSPVRGKRGETANMRYLFLTLAVSVALLLAAVTLYMSMSGRSTSGEPKYVNSSLYQAVFLNNNQVYFGRIKKLNDKYLVLDDVFYLQVNQTVQPNQSSTTQQNNNLVLQKLGKTELHGPEDRMVINRSEVTFWENIKKDSQVVKAITQYKENPDAANQNNSNNTSNGSNNSSNNSSTNKKP